MNAKKILLVDSMELALKMEEEILRRSGLDILTARSGAEALELTRTHKPDLVLLEQSMPEMSGEECCRTIKANAELNHIPVLLMVGSTSPDLVRAAFSANCEDIITKPLDQAEVVQKITDLLQLQTRKHPRLNLTTPVQIERNDEVTVAECVNLNRRGILVKSPKGFSPAENHCLSFNLSAADQSLAVWSKLERQLAPGEERNPGTDHLALFRFLNMPNQTADRIDRLAEAQIQQAAKAPPPGVAVTSFAPVQQVLQRPLDDYQRALLALAKNVNQVVEGYEADENPPMQVMVSSLKPWEKKSLTGTTEEDEAIRRALTLRLKLIGDQKRLEKLQTITPDDQQALRGLQKDYFGVSDKILDALQTQINAKMQGGQLEVMKQLNQTKTEAFKNYVTLKALMNRLMDPKAAQEASQFRSEGEDEAHKVTAFARPKPKEEQPKVEAYVPAHKKKPGVPYVKITLAIALAACVPFTYFSVRNFFFNSYVNSNPSLAIEFQNPYPIEYIRESGKFLLITVGPEWDTLNPNQKLELATKLYGEIKRKGYNAFGLYNQNKQAAGYANEKEGVKIL